MALAPLDLTSVWNRDSKMVAGRFSSVFEQMSHKVPSAKDENVPLVHLANTTYFNAIAVIAIVANSILIGVETDGPVRSKDIEDRFVYFIFETLFALIFVLEMLVRQNYHGWGYFLDPWNFFDFSLVTLTLADQLSAFSGSRSPILELASSLRVFRLLRVGRLIQGFAAMNSLWALITGTIDSLKTLFWVAVLFTLLTYCLAVALTTLVALNPDVKDSWPDYAIYCGSVERSFWTLVQVITFDSWMRDVARPMAASVPVGLIVVFAAIVILNFGVLNLIIGLVVERVLALTEQKRKNLTVSMKEVEEIVLQDIEKDFALADTTGEGELDQAEFVELVKQKSFLDKLHLLNISFDEAENLFSLIDADGSGTIDVDEFREGLANLKGVAKGHDLVELINRAQKARDDCAQYAKDLEALNEYVASILVRVEKVGDVCTQELRYRNDASVRTERVWRRAHEREELLDVWERDRLLSFPERR